ncbi:Acetyl-CoA acetyltransferase [Candidatus Fokinia solitaria]|uniref:Acetyl-CoA acetyltransferase n=1 Tax=Candidatus Fokinia solitaria TaxID=1802984 RepID=A0A2U8BSK1_9RICK|nr:acetyl-CoA C-acetyltransferase [Candidatus Fokinia solitaria]AWD33278.1 Acetyl-CoA acetyltransferase [Candidatus Fokinia solitaria]
MRNKIVIVGAKRSPIGMLSGALKKLHAHEIGIQVIEKLLSEVGVKHQEITEVIVGQVLTSLCGQNPARQLSLGAKIPTHTPAWLVNQVCGSGLRAIHLGMNSIFNSHDNENSIVIAGGQESMSKVPHATHLRSATKLGNALLQDVMIFDGLLDPFNNIHMGITAENLAIKYNISRQEQDAFAMKSQEKANLARKNDAFLSEIAPIVTQDHKKGEIVFTLDESVKLADLEKIFTLRPAFQKNGTVTAGNSSPINDGAAYVILTSEAYAKSRNLTILATIESFAQSGVDPAIMGIGPVSASRKALQYAGWKVADLNLIEANEAFAAQAIAVNKEMLWNEDIVNVNGGAIALGHPIGASGARILVTLIHALRKRGGGKGLATLCVGGGMGVAMCITV